MYPRHGDRCPHHVSDRSRNRLIPCSRAGQYTFAGPPRRSPACRTSIRAYRERARRDRKSTRLNSSHLVISYAVFCLKKKKKLYYRKIGLVQTRIFFCTLLTISNG